MTKLCTTLSAVALVTLSLMAPTGFAQYPDKPVKIVAPFPAGGFTDVVTRQVGARLAQTLGQAVVVENKPGAGTNIGTEAVTRAAPDGYTLLMGTSSLAINPTLYSKLGYDAGKDLAPIGVFATTGYTLIANKDLAPATTADLISFIKAHPDTVSFGSSGNGAVNHLAGEMFASMAGIKMLHVPYKGSQAAITDLIGGRIQLFWASTLEAMPLIKSGRVKAYGVTDAVAVSALPELKPLGETVKGYEVLYWMALFAPAGTPPAVIQRLSTALRDIAGNSDIKASLQSSGASAAYRSPTDTEALLRRETDLWGKAVRQAGTKVE